MLSAASALFSRLAPAEGISRREALALSLVALLHAAALVIMVATEVDLWTACYTPRELRLLLERHGFAVDSVRSVDPGAYRDDEPTTESSEFLVAATRVRA